MTRRADLVADIGGTNARFALVEGGQVSEPIVLATSEYATAADAIRQVSDLTGVTIDRACLGMAAPITGDTVALSNSHWSFSMAEMKAELGLGSIRVVNDFAALAASLPALTEDDLVPVVPGNFDPSLPQLIIGPGTGLGMAFTLRDSQGKPIIVETEGAYANLPVLAEREIAAWSVFQKRYGRVSVERVLCGSGLEELHAVLGLIDGVERKASAREIVRTGVADRTSTERDTLEMFVALLGDVAGNAVLTTGARGGIFLNGDMINAMLDILPQSQFAFRLNNKGRGRPFVAGVPAAVITDRFAALKGCAQLLG